jgi:hypothetical protein
MVAKTDLVMLLVAGAVIFGAQMRKQREGRAAFERSSEPLVARVIRILRRLRPSRRFMSVQWNEFQERELQERIADDE